MDMRSPRLEYSTQRLSPGCVGGLVPAHRCGSDCRSASSSFIHLREYVVGVGRCGRPLLRCDLHVHSCCCCSPSTSLPLSLCVKLSQPRLGGQLLSAVALPLSLCVKLGPARLGGQLLSAVALPLSFSLVAARRGRGRLVVRIATRHLS